MTTDRIVLLVGMALVTAIPRLLPMWLLGGRTLPKPIQIWLNYVPAAVLAALLFPNLLVREGTLDFDMANHHLWLAIPTFLVAIKTRNVSITILVGLLLSALTAYFLG